MKEEEQDFFLNARVDDFFDEKYDIYLETEYREGYLGEEDMEEIVLH